MKRILASLAVLAIMATGAWAQSSDSYGTSSNTNATTNTNTNTLNSTDNTSTTNTTDQTSTSNDMSTTDDNNNLPATASPLPTLALSGLGMIGTGVWLLRRRRAA